MRRDSERVTRKLPDGERDEDNVCSPPELVVEEVIERDTEGVGSWAWVLLYVVVPTGVECVGAAPLCVGVHV